MPAEAAPSSALSIGEAFREALRTFVLFSSRALSASAASSPGDSGAGMLSNNAAAADASIAPSATNACRCALSLPPPTPLAGGVGMLPYCCCCEALWCVGEAPPIPTSVAAWGSNEGAREAEDGTVRSPPPSPTTNDEGAPSAPSAAM